MIRFVSQISLVTCLCVAGPVVGADRPLVVELWPGKVPDETGNIGAEMVRMSPKLDRKQVEVSFVFFSAEISLLVLIALCVGLGFAAGYLFEQLRARRKQQ